jgi:hypothetical protein
MVQIANKSDAWYEGFECAEVGHERDYNPYPPKSAAFDEWERGYEDFLEEILLEA